MRKVMRMALMRNGNEGPTSRRRRDSRGRYMEGNYGAYDDYIGNVRGEYDLYVMPNGRRMGFGEEMRYMPPYGEDMNDNDIRRRSTGRENGEFAEVGEHSRYPTSRYNRGANMHYGKSGGAMGYRQGGMQMHGMGMAPPLTREMAEEWVESMDGENDRGETWTMEEIEELAEKHGYPKQEKKLVELYAVMNMLASDYYKVAEKFSVLEDEFFLCMAKAFINDKDAVPNKVAAYYEYIVKKDE